MPIRLSEMRGAYSVYIANVDVLAKHSILATVIAMTL